MCKGLDEKVFEEGMLVFADFVLDRKYPVVQGIVRARKLG